VHVFFRAKLHKPEFGPGTESLEVKLVTADEIPWADIAFPSTKFTLERYLEDRRAGREDHHFTTFERRSSRPSAPTAG
jgi:hypothetical protein